MFLSSDWSMHHFGSSLYPGNGSCYTGSGRCSGAYLGLALFFQAAAWVFSFVKPGGQVSSPIKGAGGPPQLSKHTVTYPFCIRTCRLSCCSAPLPPNPWVRPWARAGVAARQMFVSTCEFVGPPLLAQVSCASFKVVLFTSLLATQSCVYPPFELLIRVCVCVSSLTTQGCYTSTK